MLENAGNAISEHLDFKIFWGGMPPDPPRGSHLQCSFTQPPTSFTQPATSKLTENTAIHVHVAHQSLLQSEVSTHLLYMKLESDVCTWDFELHYFNSSYL